MQTSAVELWFKTTASVPCYHAQERVVSRTLPVCIRTDGKRGASSTRQGRTDHTPAVPFNDGSWHHVCSRVPVTSRLSRRCVSRPARRGDDNSSAFTPLPRKSVRVGTFNGPASLWSGVAAWGAVATVLHWYLDEVAVISSVAVAAVSDHFPARPATNSPRSPCRVGGCPRARCGMTLSLTGYEHLDGNGVR